MPINGYPPNNSSMKSSCRSSAASHSFGTAASRSSVSGSGSGWPRPASIAITLIAWRKEKADKTRMSDYLEEPIEAA